MKIPHLDNTTFSCVKPVSSKVLLYLCERLSGGRSVGFVSDCSDRIHVSERAWRAAVAQLAELGVIEYSSGPGGYVARPLIGSRWTWVPSFGDGRLRLATPRACKVLIAVCRVAHNKTRAIKMRIGTIAERVRRSARTVQLALAELADRSILNAHRTGRANWFVVRAPDDHGLFDRPEVAHRAGLLLRLLSSSTPEVLSTVIQHKRFDRQTASAIRGSWISVRELDTSRRFLVRRLRGFGVDRDNAHVFVLMYTPDEVGAALEMAVGRRTENPTEWIRTHLERGTASAHR